MELSFFFFSVKLLKMTRYYISLTYKCHCNTILYSFECWSRCRNKWTFCPWAYTNWVLASNAIKKRVKTLFLIFSSTCAVSVMHYAYFKYFKYLSLLFRSLSSIFFSFWIHMYTPFTNNPKTLSFCIILIINGFGWELISSKK